jgi:hypothetical protein
MSEFKTLTPEEVDNLKDLNKQFGKVLNSIGEIEIKLQLIKQKEEELKEEKKYLMADYETLRKKETEVSKLLLDKYGEGKIDIESGKIELI